MPPAGLAKFDSAAAMAQALARFLGGTDFPALGQPGLLRMLTRGADLVPPSLRKRLYAHIGAMEGVRPEKAGDIDTGAIARWAADLYPRRRYPAVAIGSAGGALVHLAAAFGMPWLPQTFLLLLRQKQVHPDDPAGALEAGLVPGKRFLEANPDVQLHHLHDPSQDRLMLDLVTYFRFKYRRPPQAYLNFLEETLAPDGVILLAECGQSWPVTRVGERHFFQFGAVGGPTLEEYFHGGERVRDYLRREKSPRERWDPPEVTHTMPEAEWGYDPAWTEEIAAFARRRGHRLLRLPFGRPDELSGSVADLYRTWSAERGCPANRLVIESFVLLEPYWVIRTGSVPFWMTFNMEPSLAAARDYLSRARPYDHLGLMLFPHGVESVGLPPVEDWRALLNRGRQSGAFFGVNSRTYPAHFSVFARYSSQVRNIPERYPLPPPLPIERLEEFVARTAGS